MKKKNLVSIIMNCHNGEKFLYESILSVVKQTYKNWELIFFDNNSNDNSKNIVFSFKDKRIKYYKSKLVNNEIYKFEKKKFEVFLKEYLKENFIILYDDVIQNQTFVGTEFLNDIIIIYFELSRIKFMAIRNNNFFNCI